jgi:hypothetical protein
MPKVSLTVEVPEFTEEELRSAVLAAVVERVLGYHVDDTPELIEGRRGDDPDDFRPASKRVEGAFLKRLRQQAEEHLTAKVKAIVEARTATVVDEVLASEFTPVSRFGEAGKPTTLRQMIGDFGLAYLTAEVDGLGKPVERYHNGPKWRRLDWHVQAQTTEVFKSELLALVKAASEDIKRSLSGKVAAEVTDTVQRLLGLPTTTKGS